MLNYDWYSLILDGCSAAGGNEVTVHAVDTVTGRHLFRQRHEVWLKEKNAVALG